LNKLPKTLSTVAEAMTAFMPIIGASKESLKKILLMGEFDESPDDKMHCTARLVEMLNQCSYQLHECNASDSKSNFLVEEIAILEKAK
ncbi:PREDICTED: dynamin-related, partial [Prunus dulcis]